MTNAMKNWCAGVALLILIVVPACGGKIPVPAELDSGGAFIPITERATKLTRFGDDPFVMGPYKVSGLDRGWQRSGPGWNWFGIVPGKGASKETLMRDYAFNFVGAGGQVRAECGTQVVKYRIEGHAKIEHDEHKLGCRCVGAGLDAEVRVQADDDNWSGEASLHGGKWPIRVVRKDTNGVPFFYPIGFEVNGSQAMGLVEYRPPGRVWLAKTLDPISHAELACLFSGLLLIEWAR